MAKEICISSTPHETRLAILEDDQLAEIYYERENEYTLAGSIYNGRVTRVLPGMQSAFVDLGLERDAFLYVTDFIELEDQEETDELERAASTGQAPREIQHEQGRERNGGRHEERGPRNGQRQDAPAAPSRPAHDAPRSATPAEFESAPAGGRAETGQKSAEGDERHWRGGRRRRRGGRGQGSPQPASTQTGPNEESFGETESEAETVPGPYRSEAPAAPQPERGHKTTPAFVLPGESLSKYGGAPAPESAKSATEAAMPVRRGPTFKPSTLVEAPLSWDGSGLLPGESISRHRARPVEPQAEAGAELQENFVRRQEAESPEEEAFEESEEQVPPALHEIEAASPHEPAAEFELETVEASSSHPLAEEGP